MRHIDLDLRLGSSSLDVECQIVFAFERAKEFDGTRYAIEFDAVDAGDDVEVADTSFIVNATCIDLQNLECGFDSLRGFIRCLRCFYENTIID